MDFSQCHSLDLDEISPQFMILESPKAHSFTSESRCSITGHTNADQGFDRHTFTLDLDNFRKSLATLSEDHFKAYQSLKIDSLENKFLSLA